MYVTKFEPLGTVDISYIGRKHGAQTALYLGSRVATVRGELQAALRTHPAPAPPQASSVRHAVSAAMKRRTSSKELKSGAGEMRTWLGLGLGLGSAPSE